MSIPEVFVSYAHEDIDRVRPLVETIEQVPHSVWWDQQIPVGSKFREAIESASDAVCALVVVWSHASINNNWVRDEADLGDQRGRLLGVRLDDVAPPIGLRQYNYADLAAWDGSDNSELSRLLASIDGLLRNGVLPQVYDWRELRSAADGSREAGLELGNVSINIETASSLFRAHPAAMDKLSDAMNEVYRTFAAVIYAVTEFDTPPGPLSSSADYYVNIARGRLGVAVDAKRGHCSAIGRAYFDPDGIKDRLSENATDAELKEIEKLTQTFSYLDGLDDDAFQRMSRVTDALAAQASAIANMLAAGEEAAAAERLKQNARTLATLERALNGEMGKLLQVTGKLGVKIDEVSGRSN